MSDHDKNCEYKLWSGPPCDCKCGERRLEKRVAELEKEKQGALWPIIKDRTYERLMTERDQARRWAATWKQAAKKLNGKRPSVRVARILRREDMSDG